MKRILYIFLLLAISLSAVAQSHDVVCNLGFAFQISSNPSWGINEPVITDVTPGSPADKAGLKRNDIILEVNGKGTYLKSSHTIMSWFDENQSSMSIGVRNFEYSFKQFEVRKDCRFSNAINEFQLTPVFSFYSLEDVQDRRFVMPIVTNSNNEVEFFNYRTYDFAPYDESTKEIDERINAIISRSLSQIGLKQDKENPDIIIQTFYSYQSNPLYRKEFGVDNQSGNSWRFDTRNNKMVRVPIFDVLKPIKVNEVMYELEFGYRVFDKKNTEPGASSMVFESEVKENLSSNYGLLEYLELNLPLIMMKFPNYKDKLTGKFHVKFTRFNYTGINYDMNDLRTVLSVDVDSPAANAGIMPGDIVERIQGKNFNHNASSLTDSYRRFINETMKYRDQNTKYTDANGYSNAMFWDVSHYYNIAKEISDKRSYKSGFTYLFSFNQYIDWNQSRVLTIDVKRGSSKMSFEVSPELKRYTQVYVD